MEIKLIFVIIQNCKTIKCKITLWNSVAKRDPKSFAENTKSLPMQYFLFLRRLEKN